MAATEGSARIQFKALKGFPAISTDKLETQAFLAASKEIVTVIGDNDAPDQSMYPRILIIPICFTYFPESFGKLFTPVISDMNGNINVRSPGTTNQVIKLSRS